MQIWKFPLARLGQQTVSMPFGAIPLTVQVQNGCPCIWALCDDTVAEKTPRVIQIYGTGHPMPRNPGNYLGTFQLTEGSLVFHAFEETGRAS